MKRIFFSLVMGLLCLSVIAQDATKDFYKKGELMIGVSPGISSVFERTDQGHLKIHDAFSNKLSVGYFVKDNWLVGAKVRTNLFVDDWSLKLEVPNAALYSRYYVGKGAWRAFFELEGGMQTSFRGPPNTPNEVEEFKDLYFQGGYGISFRPGKGRMSLEISNSLFRVSKEYGGRTMFNNANMGINFHF